MANITGLMPLRQNLESWGFNVGYDPNTKNVSATKKGYNPLTFYPENYQNEQGRTYVDPSLLNAQITGARNPQQLDTQAFQGVTDVFKEMYQPALENANLELSNMLGRISAQAGTKRNEAQRGYSRAESNLENRQSQARKGAVNSAIARGVYTSGVEDYNQNQITEDYAPQFGQLETEQANTLADIANWEQQSTSELGSYAKEVINNYLANLMQGSLGQYNRQQETQAADQAAISTILQNASAQTSADKRALLPWTQGMTPAEKAANELNWAQLNQGTAGSKETAQNNLGTAMDDIWREANRRNKAGEPVNTIISDLEAQIWKNAGAYRQNGVDPQDVVDYLWRAVTGETKPKATTKSTTTTKAQPFNS